MRDLVVDLRTARRRLESAVVPPVERRPRIRRSWVAAAVVAVAAVAGVAWQFWPASPAPVGNKPSIAVLHFENNTGDASLDWLRTGLTDMLVTDLSQSPAIEVLGTDRLQQILMELNRADARSVSFDVVQQLARRAGVTTVLVGSYVKSGSSIRINARLQDASDGRIVSAERVEAAGESNLFPTLDDLTRRIRAKLEVPSPAGQSTLFSKPTTISTETAGIDRDLREVTTSSVEAYRYYAEGINLHERLRDAESVPLFERALAIDPNFALAMAKLAVVHENLNHPAESVEYARRAYEHIDRVTMRERFYIEGEHFANRQDTLARAIDAYERGLNLYPDHASIRNNLALMYLQLDRRDDALPHYEELRRRRMTFTGTYGALANIYASRGEFDRAVQVLQEYLGQHPDIAQAHGFLGNVYVAWGKLDEANAAFDRVRALEPASTIGSAGSWNVHVLRGQWAEAEAIAARLSTSKDPFRRFLGYSQLATLHLYHGYSSAALVALERATQAYSKPVSTTAQARVRRAAVLLARNNGAAALAEAQEARRESAGTVGEWPAIQAISLAQMHVGRTVEASATLDELRRKAAQLPSEREVRRAHHLTAQLALARGDYPRATEEALAAHKRLPLHAAGGPGGIAATLAPQIWFTLGSAYLAAGRLDEAEQWFRRIVESRTERIAAPIEYGRSLFFLGTIHEKRGDMDAARAAYRRFLEHWRDGDLDRDRVTEAERKLRNAITN